jgi:hypothetical protein
MTRRATTPSNTRVRGDRPEQTRTRQDASAALTAARGRSVPGRTTAAQWPFPARSTPPGADHQLQAMFEACDAQGRQLRRGGGRSVQGPRTRRAPGRLAEAVSDPQARLLVLATGRRSSGGTGGGGRRQPASDHRNGLGGQEPMPWSASATASPSWTSPSDSGTPDARGRRAAARRSRAVAPVGSAGWPERPAGSGGVAMRPAGRGRDASCSGRIAGVVAPGAGWL